MTKCLLENKDNEIGFAIASESRQITRITYLFSEKSLQVFFDNNESDTFETEIDRALDQALFLAKEIRVKHFPEGVKGTPVKEYKVPLDM
jgi:hypothetical protein